MKQHPLIGGVGAALVLGCSFALGFLSGDPVHENKNLPTAPALQGRGRSPQTHADTIARSGDHVDSAFGEILQIGGYASQAHRAAALVEVCSALSLEDIRTLSTRMKRLPEEMWEDTEQALFDRLLEIDPAAGGKLVQESRDLSAYTYLQSWARSDPAAALGWAMTLKMSDKRWRHTRVRMAVSEADLALAARLVLASAVDAESGVLDRAFAAWGRQAPEAALAGAVTIPNLVQRRIATKVVFEQWLENDPGSAQVWFDEVADLGVRTMLRPE